jgi:hypothetical protein
MSESTWSLKIRSSDTIIWTGSLRTSPEISRLSKLLPVTLSADDLSDLTVQVVKYAPLESLPTLLTALCSIYLRSPQTGAIDMNALSAIAATEHRMVCGKVFKKGDIVWNCRSCGKDPTCVQCDPCFRKSNHQGHEVYFHRAEGGSGCCDCGDPEAWAKHGNCSDHQPKEDDENYYPTDVLPQEVIQGFRSVLQGCFSWISLFTILSVRSYEPISNNQIVSTMRQSLSTYPAVLRLHNDDVHTYDEVIRTLRSLNFSMAQSETLTKQVDQEGSAIILKDMISSEKFDDFTDTVINANNTPLIMSISPLELVLKENRIPCILKWMISLGEFSDSFRRLISEELLFQISLSSFEKNPFAYQNTTVNDWKGEFSSKFSSLKELFAHEGQFPLEITQLSSMEFHQLRLSSRCSVPVENPLFPTYEEELKDRIRRPSKYSSVTPLNLLMMASPFLSITTQKILMEIVMKFQHDLLFKNGFSQIITVFYPSLKSLYCRHYGLAKETIFQTTVQVYTANSIVELMSSIGIPKRVLAEWNEENHFSPVATPKGHHHGRKTHHHHHQQQKTPPPLVHRNLVITNMLASTLYTVLKDLGCPNNPEFLNHHSIRTHRLSYICRDFEYICSDPYYCVELLRGKINPGTVSENYFVF